MFILISSCSLCDNQYSTGITVITSIIEINVPKKIIAAIPDHMGPPVIIIGKTPIEAAAEVRKIGRIRRLPASKAAWRTDLFLLKRKNST